MQYQSFPNTPGTSNSFEKLLSLRLPDVKDKRFLDVGCNEGFFCGFAFFSGAKEVIGIDKNAIALKKASMRFPEVTFLNQSWDNLPKQEFDVITFLSALHYADDQEALIHELMSRLSKTGVLILELSLAPGRNDEWLEIKRSIDTRLFPTRTKLSKILEPYAWKIIGQSVIQSGDPLPRVVVHVRKLLPYAFLLMELPASGKTTLSRQVFEPANIPILSGDVLYSKIAKDIVQCSPELTHCIKQDFKTFAIDQVIERVFADDFYREFLKILIENHQNKNILIDSYVPQQHWSKVISFLRDAGYFPVVMSWDGSRELTDTDSNSQRVKGYLRFLTSAKDNAAVFSIKRASKVKQPKDIRWHLDFPVNGQYFIEEEASKLVGWVCFDRLVQPDFSLQIILRHQNFNIEVGQLRNDVWQALLPSFRNLKMIPKNIPVGFNIKLKPSDFNDATLSISVDNEVYELATISIRPSAKLKSWFGIPKF